jgi:hypothetical protein
MKKMESVVVVPYILVTNKAANAQQGSTKVNRNDVLYRFWDSVPRFASSVLRILYHNGHLWIGRTNLGRPRSVPRSNKCYVENLRHFLAHNIPYYRMRYLGLEKVYEDQL